MILYCLVLIPLEQKWYEGYWWFWYRTFRVFSWGVNSFTSLAKQQRICTQNIFVVLYTWSWLKNEEYNFTQNVFVAHAQITLELCICTAWVCIKTTFYWNDRFPNRYCLLLLSGSSQFGKAFPSHWISFDSGCWGTTAALALQFINTLHYPVACSQAHCFPSEIIEGTYANKPARDLFMSVHVQCIFGQATIWNSLGPNSNVQQ